MATLRQKKVFKEVVNGSTISSAMVKAGYSLSTAKRTNKVTRTKGWEEMMEQHLPDSLLAKTHKEGLKASKTQYKNNNETGEIEQVGVEPDFAVRHKYLDSAYKLKGRYMDSEKPNKTLIINITGIAAQKYGINQSTSPDNS